MTTQTKTEEKYSPDNVRTRERAAFYDKTNLLWSRIKTHGTEVVTFPDEALQHELEHGYASEFDDKDEARIQAANELFENLAYWTLYFAPEFEEVETALKCGLTPFRFYDEDAGDVFFLALSGSGMDLSPKLDAYQALTSGTIDPGSKLFRQPDYFPVRRR